MVPTICVGSIVFKDERILLVKRANEPFAGAWTLPGGKVEYGESLEAALYREIMEECGIRIEIKKLVDVIDLIENDPKGNPIYHYSIIDYESKYLNGKLEAASDAIDVAWFNKEQLPSISFPAITQSFLLKNYPGFYTTRILS